MPQSEYQQGTLLTAILCSQLLDMLLEVNNSAQIPFEKRIDIALRPPSDSDQPILPIDKAYSTQKEEALRRLETLLNDVPHTSYATAKENNAAFVQDLAAGAGEIHPASFLSADDIDDYIHALDQVLPPTDSPIPTLAPTSRSGGISSQAQAHAKNPTSVGNWLRKHAPKSFLQDGDNDDDKDTSKRSRGGRSERSGKTASGKSGKRGRASERPVDGDASVDEDADTSRAPKSSRSNKRSSLAADKDTDASMDDDGENGTPAPRGKRKREDDQGSKHSNGASRPSKKKRKSEGEGA